MHHTEITIHHIFISPGHNYFGNSTETPLSHPTFDMQVVEAHAGMGLVGDRFYGWKPNQKGQITFFSYEVFESLLQKIPTIYHSPDGFRRNILVSGMNLPDLIGEEFEIGDVRFFGNSHCSPCRWMDNRFGNGALDFLHGRGGLRASILTDGDITKGHQILNTHISMNQKTILYPVKPKNLP